MKTFCKITISLILIITSVLVSGSCNYIQKKEDTPKDWIEVKNEYFSFFIPSSITQDKIKSIDSFVGQYSNNRFLVAFAYGVYENDFSDNSFKNIFTQEIFLIDGKWATVASYHNDSDINYPRVIDVHFGKIDESNKKLILSVRMKSNEDRQIALRIINTIKFNQKL